MNKLVVDASVALRWVLKDEKEVRADALLYQCMASLSDMLVPPLFLAEVTNAVYLSVRRHRLTLEEAKLALETIIQIGMQVIEPSGLYLRSLELAVNYGMSNAYDAQYLALAEMKGCESWTADERLAMSIKPSPPWVKLV
jgi:predicted nucleic acid-binding protein